MSEDILDKKRKELYELKLFESMFVRHDWFNTICYTRVPGGWMYQIYELKEDCRDSDLISTTFIPYSDETFYNV